MIDLSGTRSSFLAGIGAPAPDGGPLLDVADPRVAHANARLRLRGGWRDDIFALLEFVLSERYAAVPRLRLVDDLLMPLKSALGNAQKHGNRNDAGREIAVEIVLAPRGALVAITDEGPGFDPGATLKRLRDGETYFSNHGAGFANLDRAGSRVAYENGGRTLLLCYEAPGAQPLLGRALDPAWVRARLPAALSGVSSDAAALESCHAWAADDGTGGARDIHILLRLAGTGSRPPVTRTLTGRLHATAAAARTAFAAADALHGGLATHRLRIPRPMARLADEPRLVLFDFHPWMNLAEYMAHRGTLEAARSHAGRVGRALAALHTARLDLAGPADNPDPGRPHTLAAAAARNIGPLPGGPEAVDHLLRLARPPGVRAGRARRPRVPIHGALGFDSIRLGVDRRFYLYRFEACRLGDAAIDLGAFAADLLWFTAARPGTGADDACLARFLAAYAARGGAPIGREELRPYAALALLERLARGCGPDETLGRHLTATLAALHAMGGPQ